MTKLWVFDSVHYLEIFAAETIEEAKKEAQEVEREIGMEFVLHQEWKIYQDEHEKGER